jgi:hypothetical protein
LYLEKSGNPDQDAMACCTFSKYGRESSFIFNAAYDDDSSRQKKQAPYIDRVTDFPESWHEHTSKNSAGEIKTRHFSPGLPHGVFFNPCLGKFWRVLQWKMLVYFTAIWYTSWTLKICLGVFCKFFPVLVCCTKKNLATLFFRQPAKEGRNRPFKTGGGKKWRESLQITKAEKFRILAPDQRVFGWLQEISSNIQPFWFFTNFGKYHQG